jgi:hypothetical protein
MDRPRRKWPWRGIHRRARIASARNGFAAHLRLKRTRASSIIAASATFVEVLGFGIDIRQSA